MPKEIDASAQSHAEAEADLGLLEGIRWFDKALTDRICAASAATEEDVLFTLRLEATRHLAEFFYALAARGIRSETQIAALAELHNEYIVELTKDEARMARLGLRADRLLQAIFTADTLPRLLQNWRERPGAVDQSNLARFLAPVMSTETCRKLLVAGERAGFIAREKTPYGTILISSTGVLERIIGTCLCELRTKLDRGGASP